MAPRKAAAARKPTAKTGSRTAAAPRIRVRRVYDPADKDDGVRVLVDRLWPRGLSKTDLSFDAWPKHLAPSNELRKWYHANPSEYDEFRERYRRELAGQGEGLDELRTLLRGRRVTLLTAAKGPQFTHADVLRDLLLED